eukprot:scaffold31472_cov114-Isochrysis_galbana.AAC.3
MLAHLEALPPLPPPLNLCAYPHKSFGRPRLLGRKAAPAAATALPRSSSLRPPRVLKWFPKKRRAASTIAPRAPHRRQPHAVGVVARRVEAAEPRVYRESAAQRAW